MEVVRSVGTRMLSCIRTKYELHVKVDITKDQRVDSYCFFCYAVLKAATCRAGPKCAHMQPSQECRARALECGVGALGQSVTRCGTMPAQKGKQAYHSASHKSNNDQLPNSLSHTQPSKHEQTSDEAAVVFTDSNALLYIVLRSMSPRLSC